MERNDQNESSPSKNTIELDDLENTPKNQSGLTNLEEKIQDFIKNLTLPKNLYNLKLIFEDSQNEFSPQILINSLMALSNTTQFNFYSTESVARLELHIRTLIIALERICFSPIRLSRELRESVYNSLVKFAEIHRKTTQVVEDGFENNFKPKSNQFSQQKYLEQNESTVRKRNYNIDFLLIHLRDTLHSLRDDETWFQELIRRVKGILKAAIGVAPGILSKVASGVPCPNDTSSISSMITQLREGLCFKYPIARYYFDWRTLLIIQHNIDKIISKKFGEKVIMEYLWSYLEEEQNGVDKTIFYSQIKFDELSNKIFKAFTIKSFHEAPSSFIQFKAIEILIHLYNINKEIFSIIKIDFDQYSQNLNENSLTYTLERFQSLLNFAKDKFIEDLKIINYDIGKGNGKLNSSDKNVRKEQISDSCKVLDVIADEMTCPIGYEPTNQICVLKCQHILSLCNFKKLKQSKCPKCREIINDNDVRYLSLNAIYRNLYPHFHEAGYSLTSIGTENLETHDNDSSDSDDVILAKKANINKLFKFNSNKSLRSVFQIRLSKKQHPAYQNIIKELTEKNYEKAEYWCKEFLKDFPKSYSIRCILAYIYRILNNYEQAYSYINEAINLKERNSIALCIRGEIHYRQKNYYDVINDLNSLIKIDKTKIKNLNIILGNSRIFQEGKEGKYHVKDYLSNYDYALKSFTIALQHDPHNYICLKHCAFIYEEKKDFLNALEMLSRLLEINYKDSIILCYYGEILVKLGRYDHAIVYFTDAIKIDPENGYILYKKSFMNLFIEKDDEALSQLHMALQFDPSDYYRGLNLDKMNIDYIRILTNDYIIRMINDNLDISKTNTTIFTIFEYSAFKDFLLFKQKGFVFYQTLNVQEIQTTVTGNEANGKYFDNMHTLEYENLKKLVGLGWIEYTLPFVIENDTSIDYFEPSIEINNSSNDILVDYVRFTKFKRETIRLSHMVDSLPKYDSELSIPKVFNDKYFSEEVENLIELKDLIT
ncbi:3899_t:CDS:2 [Funneliformis geosporum]|nr:3899_t:CDS:2 [Funneliformis geosporum]